MRNRQCEVRDCGKPAIERPDVEFPFLDSAIGEAGLCSEHHAALRGGRMLRIERFPGRFFWARWPRSEAEIEQAAIERRIGESRG